jgi:hypothetical protein
LDVTVSTVDLALWLFFWGSDQGLHKSDKTSQKVKIKESLDGFGGATSPLLLAQANNRG